MEPTIAVTYDATSDPVVAQQWLSSLDSPFAADFEVSLRYTPEERLAMQDQLVNLAPRSREAIAIRQALSATALDHPYHCVITHFSFATSDSYGRVIICDTDQIRDLVLDFLVTTPLQQIWHNASYDFKHIYFNTRRFPINYEDTQILSKTLINHCDISRARTGLKELAGHRYGSWALASDSFDLSNMYDPDMHRYAATDACATYWLWQALQPRFKE